MPGEYVEGFESGERVPVEDVPLGVDFGDGPG